MKLLFDHNLPRRLVKSVSHKFPGSTHVTSAGLAHASDREIWEYAITKNYCICTKDADFHQLSFLYGPPPKIVWLKAGSRTTWEIAEILEKHLDDLDKFSTTDEALMIIFPAHEE